MFSIWECVEVSIVSRSVGLAGRPQMAKAFVHGHTSRNDQRFCWERTALSASGRYKYNTHAGSIYCIR